MSNSFISGQPSVQGEDGAQNSNEQQQATDLQEYSWNLIKVRSNILGRSGRAAAPSTVEFEFRITFSTILVS